MVDALIFDAVRTPRGKGRTTGALHPVKPVELVAVLLRALQARHGLDTSRVDDVVLGCVTPIGEQGGNIARTSALHAGWAIDTPGMQINRFCASGLDAINVAAMKVRSGWEHLIVAGGVESMSRVRMGSDGGALMEDSVISDAIGFVPQGISADLIATLEGFTRAELDAYALRSQRAAAAAHLAGRFRAIVPVTDTQGRVLLAHDEHMRPLTTLEDLALLPPAFAELGVARYDAVALRRYSQISHIHHRHTAGNSSGIVDGAAVALIGSADAGLALGLKPRARIVATALVGGEHDGRLIAHRAGPGRAEGACPRRHDHRRHRHHRVQRGLCRGCVEIHAGDECGQPGSCQCERWRHCIRASAGGHGRHAAGDRIGRTGTA